MKPFFRKYFGEEVAEFFIFPQKVFLRNSFIKKIYDRLKNDEIFFVILTIIVILFTPKVYRVSEHIPINECLSGEGLRKNLMTT